MRASSTIVGRCVLASLICLLGFGSVGAGDGRATSENRQPVAIHFSYDRPIDASAAPFVLAAADGLFGSEGLAVTTNIASGSPDAIARVADGSSDLALVDINELIRFRGRSDPISKAKLSASPKAIFRSDSGRRWRGRTASAASIRSGSNARSIKSVRISSSRNGHPRQTFSMTRSCRRWAAA